MINAAISHSASSTRVCRGNLGQELAYAVRPEANANDGEDDPPDLHESTSMVAIHLVLNTPARFGAINRNG
jgi:hypothetical protein